MTIHVEPSPQVNSYQRFRSQLEALLQTSLEELLSRLAEKELISFAPSVSVELPMAEFPKTNEEHAALIKGKTLEEQLDLWITLDDGPYPWNLGKIPRLTERGSFIQDGIERCTVAQLGRAQGIFLSREEKEKGFIHVLEFRPERGEHLTLRRSIDKRTDPVTKVKFSKGRYVDLETFVDVIGVSKEHLEDLFAPTRRFDGDISMVARYYGLGGWLDEQKFSTSESDKTLIKQKIKSKFYGSVMGTHGRAQLNRRIMLVEPSYSETSINVTAMDIEHVLKVFAMFCRDEIPADDPWDLANRKVKLLGNFFRDAADHWSRWMNQRVEKAIKDSGEKVGQEALNKILQQANLGRSGRTLFTKLVQEKIFDSPLCQRISKEQNNYLEAAGLTRRIKFDKDGHRRKAREFHWSHYGRLCPLDTPQSDDVGTTLSLSLGARISDAGVIETRCHPVLHDEHGVQVEKSTVFLPPWAETDSDGWVAFPDERDALLCRKKVFAHKGPERYRLVDAKDVDYIHADEPGMFSMAANLLPYRKHNDSVRGVMACSMLRQALPLKDGSPPRVGTGFEEILPKEWPYAYGQSVDSKLAFGKDMLVGYLPWKGWNFEDAIVISESAANTLTSVHDSLIYIQLRRSIEEHKRTLAKAVKYAGLNDAHLDELGVVRDRYLSDDDLLVVEKGAMNETRTHNVPEGKQGTVHSVDVIDEEGGKGGAYLRITLRQECQAKVGDKLANRHGHKGVISTILPDHVMPYFILAENGDSKSQCSCGEINSHYHLQVLINPLSVISRMNLGQLFETVEARSSLLENLPQRIPCFDPAKGNEDDRRLDGDILIGEQYIMKLDHNAEDKLHARSREPASYNSFVDQPLKGRRLKGGQRVGEMEIWALMAHNASGLMQEMLTLKSDNPRERNLLFQSLLGGATITPTPQLPEALRTLAACCYGLGLQLRLTNGKGRKIDILHDAQDSEDIRSLSIEVLCQTDFQKKISKGEITTPVIRALNSEYEFDQVGLESEQIFGPQKSLSCACGRYQWGKETDKEAEQSKQSKHQKVGRRPRTCGKCETPLLPAHSRRHRMGHIKLAKPVPNPYVFLSNKLRELPYLDIGSLLLDEPQFKFYPSGDWKGRNGERIEQGWNWVFDFCMLAFRSSISFKNAFEQKLNPKVTIDSENQDIALILDEDWAEIAELLRGIADVEDDILTVENFVARAIECFGYNRKGLDTISGLMAAVLLDGGICGIDFLVDLLRSQNSLELLCLDILPVIPPKLRQRFSISHANSPGKKYKAHDLNVVYQEVLRKNADLAKSIENLDQSSTESIKEYRKSRKALQLAVSQLLCNQLLPPRQRARDWETPGYPVRHSISSYLEDKDGLLLGHLLGKRVDYSGRAVIVPDPTLPLDTCRIPVQLAMKLYRPQLLAELRKRGARDDTDDLISKAEVGDQDALGQVRSCLEHIIGNVETAKVADDLSSLLARASQGDSVAKDKVTRRIKEGIDASSKSLGSQPMVLLNRQPTLHRLGMMGFHVELGDESVIAVPPLVTSGYAADFDGDQMAVYLPVTQVAKEEVQQMIPSNHLWHPADGGYALSMAQDLALGGFLDGQGSKKELIGSFESTAAEPNLLDRIEAFKVMAFEKSTQAGISFSIEDFEQISEQCAQSDTSGLGHKTQCIEQVICSAPDDDSIKRILTSRARGNYETMNHLAGQSQLGVSGSNLTQGLPIGEELWEAVSGRRKLVDTKLGTAEGGALTKSFIAASHHLWITVEDCGTGRGLPVSGEEYLWVGLGEEAAPIRKQTIGSDAVSSIFRRLYGRVLAEDFGGQSKGTFMDRKKALEVANLIATSEDREAANVRSALTCEASDGVCRACYGMPWTQGANVIGWSEKDLVMKGERVGVIAAQAVGEPGTQMALRKKHGVSDDEAPGIMVVKKFFDKEDIRKIQQYGEDLGLDEPSVVLRDTLDRLYRDNDIHIAPVHFEMVFTGRLRAESGWIADAAKRATGNIHSAFVGAALSGAVDNFRGLKERSVIGAGLPKA